MNPGWLSALSGQYTLIECKDGRRENNSSGGHSANILVGHNTRPATACPVAGLGVVLELAGLVESSDSPGGIRATGQSCCQPTIKLVTQPASPSRLESGAATPTSPLQLLLLQYSRRAQVGSIAGTKLKPIISAGGHYTVIAVDLLINLLLPSLQTSDLTHSLHFKFTSVLRY